MDFVLSVVVALLGDAQKDALSVASFCQLFFLYGLESQVCAVDFDFYGDYLGERSFDGQASG